MSLSDAIEVMEEKGVDGLMERLEFIYDYAYVQGRAAGEQSTGSYAEGYEQGRDDAFEVVDRMI